MHGFVKKKGMSKAPARFELAISCLLDRRFNQLSHGAGLIEEAKILTMRCMHANSQVFSILGFQDKKVGRPTWGSNPRP